MQSAGLKAFKFREAEKSGIYSFEQEKSYELSRAIIDQFKDNKAAWEFFKKQPPGYQKSVTHWIMSAKQEKTQQRRFDRLLEMSKILKRIDLLSPFGPIKK